VLNVSSFEIDTTSPVISEVTAVPSLGTDTTPDYTFNTDEAGDISYGGSCSSLTTSAVVGDNTITFEELTDGIYSDCTVTVLDSLSNASNTLSITSFEIDTTSPIISEVTLVSTPTTNNTPSYTFNSDEAGTIVYSGSCTSLDTVAAAGNNTVTFEQLSDGTYSDCTLYVSDDILNNSNILNINEFTIDTTAPSLAIVFPVQAQTSDTTPDFTFNTDEAGDIAYGGSCSSVTIFATAGDNALTLNELTDGTYDDCTVTVTDDLGNSSDALAINSFLIDTQDPVVNEVTPVPTVTSDTTPDYTFNTNQGGTIFWSGSCSSVTTTAV